MKENQASVDLALKKIQLEMTQRESVVKLVLARKQLMDNGIALADVDSLLPPPASLKYVSERRRCLVPPVEYQVGQVQSILVE
ncbi:unnamed protein product [Phytophthora fragariaefolia]|uniref:Unnamed protein product n=1 Tax=Phytophthora fragariaefolia TaxID=1490495 RepID=A0A9W6XNZ8_9STRA|nr:unnamed protein product [Phytophthora fragariaefolia]